MSTTVAVADGIFNIVDGTPVLLGSRCTNCDNHMFPRQSGCPKCMFNEQEDIELASAGTLWAWTIQAFPPKAPPYLGPTGADFEPYGVGYVELPGQVRVETRLTEADPDRLEIGMEMEIVLHHLTTDDDGNDVVTYAFAPTSSGDQS
ncbi:MAG: Zn-ribbon domain-containing OB-fold protein [Ilumatobacter sp.]